jgi:pyrimidine deaminase RibD-like protein
MAARTIHVATREYSSHTTDAQSAHFPIFQATMKIGRHSVSIFLSATAARKRGLAHALSISQSAIRRTPELSIVKNGLARCAVINLTPAARHASNNNNCRLYSTTGADEIVVPSGISASDLDYMSLALRHASIGKGGTYPNPAVGCVLVRHTDDNGKGAAEVIGQGFHPAAGLPHAEVFALFEACGHVNDGIEAAQSVLSGQAKSNADLESTVRSLLETYGAEGGPGKLFGGAFSGGDINNDSKVTAYVTLEPCCHYGQTPPCALSLKEAGVDRVVVGFRDPNPRVDGGGVQLLRDAGVEVEVVDSESEFNEEAFVAQNCADMVKCFAKRITPRPEVEVDFDQLINGAKRRGLRSLKERLVSEGSMAEVTWPNKGTYLDTGDESADLQALATEMQIDARWMENLDEMLWNNELVLMRLGNAIRKKKSPSQAKDKENKSADASEDDIADELVLRKLGKAVSKKRGVKIVAERIASDLGAHLAQVKGHTALLYRPGLPPKLNLDELVPGAGDEEE